MWPARVSCLPPLGRGCYFARKSFSVTSGNPRRTICLYSTTPPSKNFGLHSSTHCVWRQSLASSPSLCSRSDALTREESFQKMRPHISPRCPLPGFGSHLSATAPAAASATQWQQASVASGRAQQQQRRSMSSHEECPPELTRGTQGCTDIPVGGEGLYRRGTNIGMPMLFVMRYDRPTWQPLWEDEHEQIPRDGFGVPAHIPPEVSQDIKHVYHVPPQFYHFLKKIGDDTPALQPYMHKLINGDFTHDDYEEMFYKFAKPLKIYRKQIPMPYRTPEEVAREEEVAWEGAWLSYRQRVLASYNSAMYLRELLFGGLVGIYFAWVFLDGHRQYRLDMKLFYLEAPEHKVNWVKPRGDLV